MDVLHIAHAHITDLELHMIFLFTTAAVFGMGFSYLKDWAWTDNQEQWHVYAFSDKKAVVRAFTALGLLCATTGSLDLLIHMSDKEVVIAGAGIGFMGPANVRMEQIERNRNQTKKKRTASG